MDDFVEWSDIRAYIIDLKYALLVIKERKYSYLELILLQFQNYPFSQLNVSLPLLDYSIISFKRVYLTRKQLKLISN